MIDMSFLTDNIGLHVVATLTVLINYLIDRIARVNESYQFRVSSLAVLVVTILGVVLWWYLGDITNNTDNRTKVLVPTLYLTFLVYWLSFRFFFKCWAGALTTYLRHERWVKLLDYLYIFFASMGIYRLALASFGGVTIDFVDSFFLNWGPFFLTTALAIRMTKANIEANGWEKL